MAILDTRRPFIELGHQPRGQADYVFQDGTIFAWSESNCAYETAWWLDRSGRPIGGSPLAIDLATTRPFKPEWLTMVLP